MTLEQQDKKAISDIRINKAYEFLDDASANFQEGRYKTAVNRSYYAALNAMRAILILQGANPETHEGVITMLSLRLVKTGLLPVDIVKKFKLLLSRRADVDYGDFESTDRDDSEDSLKIAREIIQSVDAARKKLIQ